jgi:hypothetical protein
MADNKIMNAELSDDELNEAAGGFVITQKQIGFIQCAGANCKNKFKPRNGETLCETCRKKARGGSI